jgi:hypothetical protein
MVNSQAVLAERIGQCRPFRRPPDERRQRRRQRRGDCGARAQPSPRRGRRDRCDSRQSAAIGHLKLSQQRGDVTLDGADGDEQPGADLGIGQMFAERGQYLGLPG